jgi:hypothetical protein
VFQLRFALHVTTLLNGNWTVTAAETDGIRHRPFAAERQFGMLFQWFNSAQ